MISKATYRQMLSSSTILLASFLYGCKVGYTESATSIFLSSNSPFKVTAEDISWIASVSYGGTLISVVICYTLSNKVSRKVFILGCVATFAISWLLILATSSIIVIIVCMFFYGVAASMLVIIGNLYFAEIASPKNRELLGILYQLATAIGIQVEFPMSIFNSYRLLALFPFAVSIITLLSSVCMVESPCYLVARGQEDLARKNLCWLNDKSNAEDIEADLDGVKKYVEEQAGKEIGNMKTIFRPSNMKLTAVLIVINGISIINCNTILSQYGPVMIRDFEPTIDGTTFITVYNTLRIVCTFLSLVTIKKFERRAMLLFGFIVNGLIQLGCALCYYMEAQNGNTVQYIAILIATLLMVFLVMDQLSCGAALEVLKAEVFPHKLKEFYTSLLAFTSDFIAFATVKSYFTLTEAVGLHFTLALYSGFTLLVALFVYVFIKDTKGKSLHQIRTEYTSKT